MTLTDTPTDETSAEQEPRRRRTRWSLRRRILATFAAGALFMAVLLAVTTYGLASSNVVQQRDQSSIDTTKRNAQIVQTSLRGPAATAQPAIDALTAFGVDSALVWYANEWQMSGTQYEPSTLPQLLVDRVIEDAVPARMVTEVAGTPHIVVGWPIANGGAFFEFFSLQEVDSALSSVRLSLYIAGGLTLTLSVIAGAFAARRAVRPVVDAALAAKQIAGGRLDTRLDPENDPDLGVLAESFNDMAAALEQRLERDARFASDVSHELRSPLMTLEASIEVMESRRSEMPERAQAAVDLLRSDITRFRTLVEDLLEISRFDAGVVRLNLDELRALQFVEQAISVSSAPDTLLVSEGRVASLIIQGDRRRLARVIANLIDNARVHGDSEAKISLEVPTHAGRTEQLLHIVVEDQGPGVPQDERHLVFERFARGAAAGRRSSTDGSGLGLALVAEHIRLHNGRVWVEDRRDGKQGARFVIELPAEEIEDE
ncbi:MAG: ATP-binding protein [Ilumatobacteraceae bacterium]